MKKTTKKQTKMTRAPKQMTEEKFEKYCKDALKAYGEIDWTDRQNLLKEIRKAYSQLAFQSQDWVDSLEEALVCTTPGSGNYIMAHFRIEDVLAEMSAVVDNLAEAYKSSQKVLDSTDWSE